MFTFRRILVLTMIAALAACSSGGNDESFVNPPPPVVDTGGNVVLEVDSIQALTSNTQLQSDGGIPVTITALVRNVNNNFVEGATVSFAADTGGIQVTNSITGSDGVASALLTTAGDPLNRDITVTVSTTSVSSNIVTDTVTVAVIGTSLEIIGPSALAQGATGNYSLVLNNANGAGIGGQTIAVTSALGNTLSAQSLTTDSSGQAQFSYTAVNGGADTITATALGETAAAAVNVSGDSFAFINPAAGTEVNLGSNQTVTLRWTQNNTPVVGQSVRFAATRGIISPASAVTNANGEVSATIRATNAGRSTISADTTNGPTATLEIEFVATTPSTIEIQADPNTVAPNSQSAITAIVRDPDGNLVKNITVTFELTDITSGGLSVPNAVTNSQGRAQTFYTSSSQTSSVDGVTINARVAGTTIQDQIVLTVAGREVFFTFGTGNEIFEPNPAQYRVPYIVQVTDAVGAGVADVNVVMSVVSVKYIKGYWCFDDLNSIWFTVVAQRCNDEDTNRNGILDPEEDTILNGHTGNGNGRIEAGNIATVSPGTFTTDASGFGLIDIFYPQEYGRWLEVELQARTSVQGTEYTEKSVFLTNVIGEDISEQDISPPGLLTVPENFTPQAACNIPNAQVLLSSPFGYNARCDVWDFPN